MVESGHTNGQGSKGANGSVHGNAGTIGHPRPQYLCTCNLGFAASRPHRHSGITRWATTSPYNSAPKLCDIIDHGGYGGDAHCSAALLPLLHDRIPHIRCAVWHTLFCERCRDESKCEIGLSVELDQVALLIAIGVNDPNLKLCRQRVADLCQQMADPRVRPALEQILLAETDSEILAVTQRALKL